MERQPSRIYINAYRGPTTERGGAQYSREWADTGLGTGDELIYQQLQLSKNRGKQKVMILDLGCTRQATFFTDLLNNPTTTSNTRGFLQQNPTISLKLVGLTDANTAEEFGQVVNQTDIDTAEMRCSMRVIAYSLTAWQTLEKFLSENQIKSPNLIFAVWSLAYLSPNIFREILNTSASSLTPSGRFIGSGYTESVMAMGFGVDYNQYPNLVYFDVQKQGTPQQVWPYLIGGPQIYETPRVDAQQLIETKQLMTRFINPLFQQRLINEDQRRYILSEIQQARSLRRLGLTGSILRDPMTNLWNYKFQDIIKPKKDSIIREIMRERDDCFIESDFEKNITIQKR